MPTPPNPNPRARYRGHLIQPKNPDRPGSRVVRPGQPTRVNPSKSSSNAVEHDLAVDRMRRGQDEGGHPDPLGFLNRHRERVRQGDDPILTPDEIEQEDRRSPRESIATPAELALLSHINRTAVG